MKAKITKRLVDTIKPEIADVWVTDTIVKGFGLKVRPSGARTYFLRCRVNGERQYISIGMHGSPWTAETARKEAQKILGRVVSGEDPNANKQSEKDNLAVAQLCDQYLEDVKAGKLLTKRGLPKTSGTILNDTGRIERHIKPLLGKKRVKKLTRPDIEKFRDAITAGATAADIKTGPRGRAIVTGGTGAATRTLGLLGAILGYAETKMIIDVNPVRGVARVADKSRLKSVSIKEYAKIGEALREIEDQTQQSTKRQGQAISVQAIRALCLTGCRRNEIFALEKASIDSDSQCLRFEKTKTGAQIRPIGRTALDVLNAQDWKESSPYVFPATRGTEHIVGVPKVWQEIRQATNLNDVSLHTLRHGFASVAAELGYSELTIAGLLGHSSGSVTARYAHIVDSALVAAADRVSAEIARRLGGQATDNVIEFRQ